MIAYYLDSFQLDYRLRYSTQIVLITFTDDFWQDQDGDACTLGNLELGFSAFAGRAVDSHGTGKPVHKSSYL